MSSGSFEADARGESDAAGVPADTPLSAGRRRRWLPETSAEVASALRRLALQPWLIAGRDDAEIGAVRRNLGAIRETLTRVGWVLVVDRDFIRLRKSAPVRRATWADEAPSPIQASWFFLLVAGAESVPPRVALAQLATAARAAAAVAGLPVTHDIVERRAIVRALRMLDARGVVMQIDGDVDGFIENESAPVLLAVHHARLAHVIAHYGSADPVSQPLQWLEQVEREPDAARRMRRRLIDDTVVHASDLDSAEADWLSRRVRSDDGGPLAHAFGLHVERRTEGAAFVVPDSAFRYLHELGTTPFPAPGTVPHAALLLSEHANTIGTLGSPTANADAGWRGLPESSVLEYINRMCAERVGGQGGWRRELTEDPQQLTSEIYRLLSSLDLVRSQPDANGTQSWWFSPATGRWSASAGRGDEP